MEEKLECKNLIHEFKNCQKVLSAIGDETRQLIIIALIEGGCNPGIRVGEITSKTNLSRPAVLHHLRILRDAKIINVFREGTMNYYFLDPNQSELMLITTLFKHIEEMMVKFG